MNFNKEFGFMIKNKRENNGWSQEKLAKKISDLSRTALTNIEAGRQSCTLDTALELALNLDIEITEIERLYFKHLFSMKMKSTMSSMSQDIQSEVSQHLGLA
jgi:DNA-binding XRE family transcriptional regulator